MVKKIVKGPYSLFETDCAKCGCRFEYDLDVVNVIDGKCFVSCPSCTFNTEHYGSMEGKNRLEVVPVEPEAQSSGYCYDCHEIVLERFAFDIPYISFNGGGTETHLFCRRCYNRRKEMHNV